MLMQLFLQGGKDEIQNSVGFGIFVMELYCSSSMVWAQENICFKGSGRR